VADRTATRLVVVVPNSFKGGWVDEINKWEMPITPHVFESGADHANNAFLRVEFKQAPALIINYEAIRSEGTQQYILKFIEGKNAMIVFDESIQIGTHDAAQTKVAISLAKNFPFRRVLSGKPQRKGPNDLWSQYRAIGKFDGFNYFAFRNAFCKLGGFKGKSVVGAINEDILQERIAPFTFRATKADWLTSLPSKMYTVRNYKLTRDMQGMFDTMLEEFVLWLGNDEVVTVDAAITKYIKLAQIQAGFIIDELGKVRQLVEPAKNPRIQLLKEIMGDEVTGKVIVPYNHKYVREMLMSEFAYLNPAIIRGQMTDEEIREQKRLFNEDPRCRVIFLQTRAAKYGHTLLGGPEPENHCNTMWFFENTYSSDDRSQIEDRMHRTGQTEQCLYGDFVATVLDRNMIEALKRNESVFQAVFAPLARRAMGA
jgi:SNF2 family DNA or RNA helicase